MTTQKTTRVKSICLVCRGKAQVIDKITKLYRPCVACNGGWIYVNAVPAKVEAVVEKDKLSFKLDSEMEKAIIEAVSEFQKEFLKSRDIKDLKRMRLKDISQITKISEDRICNFKKGRSIQGIPLKEFFSHGGDGELSKKVIQALLKDIVQSEDKAKPYNDDELTEKLKKQHNIELARRTVSKYRIDLNIPPQSKRKK